MSLVDTKSLSIGMTQAVVDSRPFTIYVEVAAMTLILYDYLLTLSKEIRCIWKRKVSSASVIFAINRYVFMLGRALALVQVISWREFTKSEADSICTFASNFTQGTTILLYISAVVFAALRVYAIWGKNVKLGLGVLLLGIIGPCTSIIYCSMVTFHEVPPPFTGCFHKSQSSIRSASRDLYVNSQRFWIDSTLMIETSLIFNNVFIIIFESVVLGLTWAKTASIRNVIKQLGCNEEICVSYLLLRDGTIDLVLLIILGGVALVSLHFQNPGSETSLSDTLRSICVLRFMLDLRGVYSAEQVTRVANSADTDFQFATESRLVGNLGGFITSDNEVDGPESVVESFTDTSNSTMRRDIDP